MSSYFFTCGQYHIHRINGAVWDKNSVLQVNSKSEDAARKKVFSLVGPKWSMCYGPDDINMEYYPNGICAIITVK